MRLVTIPESHIVALEQILMLLFLPTIGGLVQFAQEVNGDPGVHVSIYYDSEHAEIVATLAQGLQAFGFE